MWLKLVWLDHRVDDYEQDEQDDDYEQGDQDDDYDDDDDQDDDGERHLHPADPAHLREDGLELRLEHSTQMMMMKVMKMVTMMIMRMLKKL